MIDFAVLKKTLRRPKILLSIVGAVLILAIWALAFFLPQGSKISSLQAQEATLQKKVQIGDATVARLRHTFQHSAQITTMRKQLYSAVPATTDAYNYVQALSAVAASSKVHLTSVSIAAGPGGNRASSGSTTITELPVSMSVTGTYDQILTLITQIFKLPRLTDIDSVNISGGGPDTSRSTTLTAQLSIIAFSAERPSAQS
jgi:Tfp pilus assembly protein PilO